MPAAFPKIKAIRYEGPDSTNPLAFKHYNPGELVEGRPMKDHLRFSVVYWHTMRGMGADVAGADSNGAGNGGGRRLARDGGPKWPNGRRFLKALMHDELGIVRVFASLTLHHLLHCISQRIGLAAWQITALDIGLAVIFLSGLIAVVTIAIAGAVRTCLRAIDRFRRH